MRRSRSSRSRYRGSRGGIGVLIPVLIVLCIIAAGTLYFINEKSTFTREGAVIKTPEKEKTEAVEKTDVVVSEDTVESPEITVNPAEEVTGTVSTDMRGYFIPISRVKSAEQFSAEFANVPKGVNTLVLEVKSEDGTLAFANDHEFTVGKQIVGEDSMLTTAVEKARSGGYRVALFISCFKDNGAAQSNFKHSVVGSGGGVWRDETETRWLSPYSEKSRQYLTDIINKLVTFSPDEIILDNVTFPVEGKTDVIAYEETLGSKRDMLKAFISEAKTAAGETELSAVFENYNSKRTPMSGQTAADFETFGKIYITVETSQYTLPFGDGKALFDGSDVTVIPLEKSVSGEQFVIK